MIRNNSVKLLAFFLLITFTFSFQFFSWNKPVQIQLVPITIGSTKTTQKIIKGGSITTDIQASIKSIIQTGYVYYADSMTDVMTYMQKQLNTRYEGNWMISIYNGNSTNKTAANISDNLQIQFYSLNNSWYIYWQSANHYKPDYAYFLTRMPKNGTTYTCKSSTDFDSASTIFRNIVSAVEQDVKTVTQNSQQIAKYLTIQSPTKLPNVQITNNVSYYSCIWGTNLSFDLIKQTSLLKFNDLALYWSQ